MSCLNPKSIIDEEWNPDYEPSIYIELLGFYDTIYDGKKFCFRKDELRSIMNTDNYQVAKWFIDPNYAGLGYIFNDDGWVIDPDLPEQKYPVGYASIIEKYIRVPIEEGLEFYVLQQNLEAILLTDTIDFIGIVIDTTRVGKDYTVSGAHGQVPSVQIYYLVPRRAYEQAPGLVANEIYSMMFKIKVAPVLNPTLDYLLAAQNHMAVVDSELFQSSPVQSPIGSPRRHSEQSPRSSFDENHERMQYFQSPIQSPRRHSEQSPQRSFDEDHEQIQSPRRSFDEDAEQMQYFQSPIRSPRRLSESPAVRSERHVRTPVLPSRIPRLPSLQSPLRSPRRNLGRSIQDVVDEEMLRNLEGIRSSFEEESESEEQSPQRSIGEVVTQLPDRRGLYVTTRENLDSMNFSALVHLSFSRGLPYDDAEIMRDNIMDYIMRHGPIRLTKDDLLMMDRKTLKKILTDNNLSTDGDTVKLANRIEEHLL